MISHVTLGTNDVPRAKSFYDPVMACIGYREMSSSKGHVAYARGEEQPPYLYVLRPYDREPAAPGNGWHCAFMVDDRATVRAFHETALANGGSDEGAPGPRPQYGPTYYGAYVRDPDGNKLQAVCYAAE